MEARLGVYPFYDQKEEVIRKDNELRNNAMNKKYEKNFETYESSGVTFSAGLKEVIVSTIARQKARKSVQEVLALPWMAKEPMGTAEALDQIKERISNNEELKNGIL